MLDVVRQYVDAALGALPTDRAMELAARATELITGEIRKQVSALGVATKEDIDELRERLWKLETASPASAAKSAPAAKSPAARRKPAARKKKTVAIPLEPS